MGGSGNITEGQSIYKVNGNESQDINLRLRIILLFYDDLKGEKLSDDDYCTTQNGDFLAKVELEIFGEVNVSKKEEIKNERINIPEKLSGSKKKDQKILKKFQKKIEEIINAYYFGKKYKEIYLDILIPKDYESGIISSIYVITLFDKKFVKSIKKKINIIKSSISILYHEKNVPKIQVDESGSYDDKPNDVDAKIAALMSHYVYFYLDWLEYVHVHKKYKKYCYKENLSIEKAEEEIGEEFKIDENLKVGGFIGMLVPGGEFIPGGELKVKVRIVNRLREIAKIVNNTSTDSLNFDCEKIIKNVLYESKKEGRPVGFYDLYDRFGYWDYISDNILQNEAQKWYVSHPYFVFKNDYEVIYEKNNKGIYDDENVPYSKVLKIIPRKSQEIFIHKNQYKKENNEWIATDNFLIYNTVLTHGMDQLSGYGGLLFTKVELETEIENGNTVSKLNPVKFAYCTKGTDVNSFNDWIFVDLLQGVSGFSLQHVHNVKNAITINEKINDLSKSKGLNKVIPLFFCGHSLGGGLASAGAIASKGRHAITFNAAGLNFLGVLVTRTVGGFNYSFNTPYMVHPIRIDGEAVDFLMVIARFATALLNERAYGRPELIFKLKNSDKWDITEMAPKHGINNFLYKPLMNELEIVSKKTIKQPIDEDTSIATLGADNAKFQLLDINRTDCEKGNYSIVFKSDCLNMIFVSVCKLSLKECMDWFVNFDKNIEEFLSENFDWQSPT